jgi:hypothetical protein
MPDEPPPPPAKARIDAKANDALSYVDTLLSGNLQPEDLQTGLQQVKEDLQAIAMDTHRAE